MARTRAVAMSLAILSILALSTLSFAAADRIAGPIATSQTVKVGRGMPLQARTAVDRGPADPTLKMSYITMVTVPSPAQERAAMRLYLDQQNPRSASYHKWLTPEQYADRFGLSTGDMNKITNWLLSQGFLIVRTARAHNFVVFSGTAAQVEKTFQVEIHNFEGNGQKFFAPTTAPTIPAALSGIVADFHGLNNIRPVSQARKAVPGYTYVNSEQNYYFLAPGDVTAIYDIGTTYTNGYNGTGQSLVVLGETGIYQSDLTNFRQNFGLSAISCTTSSDIITACNTSNFKYVLVNGTATDIYSDLPEADIDIEWSGATAPDAKVIFVNATDPEGEGVWDSWYYAVDNDVAPVITMSYTAPCEYAEAGPFVGEYSIPGDESELQTANLEGITFMNSAGDTGAAACDYGANLAQYGYMVSYPASSQYVTGVGGTSIPSINPGEYSSTFWYSSNQNTAGQSAKGYIQEQPWNDSEEFGYLCTVADSCDLGGETVTSWATAQTAIGISAGGGGISNCAYVDDNDVCNGGFPQPSWQSGISMSTVSPNGYGITTTPARLVPDVSLLASPNFPGYLVCTQNFNEEGTATGSSCDSPTTGIQDMLNGCFAGTGNCSIFGGTSVSTPIFAGIVTLLNQYTAANSIPSPVGNINPNLYTLAASNSTNHAFNPVTTASTGSYSDGAFCEEGFPQGVEGDPWPTALVCPSSGSSAGFIGYNSYNADSTTNYSLAAGLGSVDVGNLFAAWSGANLSTTSTTLQSSENPSKYGDSVTFTATVTDTNGSTTPTGTVTFYDGGNQKGTGPLGGCICDGRNGIPLSATATFTTSSLSSSGSPHSITAVYGGDSNNATSTSAILLQVVNPATFTFVSTGSASHTVLAGQQSLTYTFTATPTSGSTFVSAVNIACSITPSDPTLTANACSFSVNGGASTTGSATIPASSGTSTVTMTAASSGPNPGTGSQIRHRADNRTPWLPMTLPLAGVVMLGIAGRKRSKYSMIAGLCVALVFAGFLIACGSSNTPPTAVSVSPEGASVYANDAADGWPSQTASFTATVTNNSNTAVSWSLSSSVSCTANPSPCGSVDANGNYTAPTIAAGLPGSVTVTATSQADSTKSASATVTLTPTTVPVNGGYTVTVTATEAGASSATPTVTLVVN